MTADDDRRADGDQAPDYRALPPKVQLDETIASVEPDPVPEPEAGRNMDQHRALRDD